jgi:AAA+ ATPase superfamily predicted ATPase
MFVGRKDELIELNELYAKSNFQMIVVYGRRRVGKTTLLAKFSSDKATIFFTAQESNDAENLRSFSQALYRYISLPESTGSFSTWAIPFSTIGEEMCHNLINTKHALSACPKKR